MFSLAAILTLFLAVAASGVSILLGLPLYSAAAGLAIVAMNTPGDIEWLLGLLMLAGIGWFFVQVGAAIGLWGL